MKTFRAQGSRAGFARPAFTLIELLIVVIIIGFLFAVIIPFFLRPGHPKPAAPAGESAQRRVIHRPQATPSVPIAASLPELDEIVATIQLAVAERRVGIDVFTHYDARYHARFLVRRPGASAIRLEVPFPEGTIEAREVALRIEGPTGMREPAGVEYGPTGIRWVGLPPSVVTPVEVDFVTRGGETFAYHLPPAARTRVLDVGVEIAGASEFSVPDTSLQPTSVGATGVRWRMRDLVTDRPLKIALPVAHTPLGQAMHLFQLAGVALLLFGAGFWYLGDLRKPGQLDDFRWGQFLLLALTYCTFFVIFAVLEFHGPFATPWSLALAAGTSLPLLLLHVSRILGRAFAFRDVLPLATVTFGLVVTGIYGADLRDYVFLATGVAAVAFITTTYPGWWAGRQAAFARAEAEGLRQAEAPDLYFDGAPEQAQVESPGYAVPHCIACGQPGGPTPFCAACGTPRARELTCPRGHEPVVLPVHLLADLGPRDLRCPACGERLAFGTQPGRGEPGPAML